MRQAARLLERRRAAAPRDHAQPFVLAGRGSAPTRSSGRASCTTAADTRTAPSHAGG
jgi:hypothetical protein